MKNGTFCLLAPPKICHFLPFQMKNIFLEIQDSRVGATIAPNKGLELALSL